MRSRQKTTPAAMYNVQRGTLVVFVESDARDTRESFIESNLATNGFPELESELESESDSEADTFTKTSAPLATFIAALSDPEDTTSFPNTVAPLAAPSRVPFTR